MKGIREIAMGTPEEEPKIVSKDYDDYGSRFPSYTPPKGQKSMFDSELYDDADYYGTGYSGGAYNPRSSKSYLPEVTPKGQLEITMAIPMSEIGDCADDNNPAYNWGLACQKATEIAYDRIEELAGKDYESRYVCTFKVDEGFLEWEAVVTLTPVKK